MTEERAVMAALGNKTNVRSDTDVKKLAAYVIKEIESGAGS